MTDPQLPDIFDFQYVVENSAVEDLIPQFEGGTAKRITTPNSAEWSDWFGVHMDLVRTMEYCEAGISLGDEPADDRSIEGNAFVLAAIMSYARPFSDGVRRVKLDTSVFDAMGSAPKAHQHFLDLRNKFVAHSVNSHEQNVAFVLLADPPKRRAVAALNHYHLQATPLNVHGFATMLRMAGELNKQAEAELERLRLLVFEEVQSMNLAQLYNYPPMRIPVPGTESAGVSRTQTKKRPGRRR